MTISYATFEIASICNMDCEFCFSYWREQKEEMDTSSARKCISRLKEAGLKAINFTGGEPLTRPDIAELIAYSKQLGLVTILTTNGILLEKKIGSFADSMDFIGLPLDSSDEATHNALRPAKGVKSPYRVTRHLMDTLPGAYPRVGFKINTLVSAQNIDSIVGIGEFIRGKTIAWKLSQFIPGGFGRFRPEKFKVSHEKYRKVVAECREHYPDINIVAAEAHDESDYCRIISSQGRLLKPAGNTLVDLGDLLSLSPDELARDFDSHANEKFLEDVYLAGKKK